jgi:DNA-binding beta-propeller fold protein YncE
MQPRDRCARAPARTSKTCLAQNTQAIHEISIRRSIMIRVRTPRRRRASLPACEALESRELLSSTPWLDHAAHRVPAALEMRAHADVQKFKGPIVTRLPVQPAASVSTIPPNGDLNPYATAVVPSGVPAGGLLKAGDILVANFNSSSNLQGTGSTIVNITPSGKQSVFYQGPTGIGLASAMGVLKRGFVIVGNIPATYDSKGNFLSAGNGSLIILDRFGHVAATVTDPNLIAGPWGLAVSDQGSKAQVFVTNVLNGTVSRIDLKLPRRGDNVVVSDMVQVGSGFSQQLDPAVFWLGPTGLAFNAKTGMLYVASTKDNAIFAISGAAKTRGQSGTGTMIYQDSAHLRGPLGLVLAPNGDLLTTNGDAINPDPTQASELIEFTPGGQFVAQLSLDSAQGGAFGLVVVRKRRKLEVATVNDVTNALDERFITL